MICCGQLPCHFIVNIVFGDKSDQPQLTNDTIHRFHIIVPCANLEQVTKPTKYIKPVSLKA